MLRPLSSRLSSLTHRVPNGINANAARRTRFMATQSGDDAKPPTALATLYLEDGSKFVGRSFGSHEAAVDGEVSFWIVLSVVCSISICVTRPIIR